MPEFEIHRKLLTQNDDNVLPRRSVHVSVYKFKIDRTRVTHEEGAERPLTFVINEKIQQAREMVMSNRCVIINEVVYSLLIRISVPCYYQGSFHVLNVTTTKKNCSLDHNSTNVQKAV